MWIASCSRFRRDPTQSRVKSLVDELAFPRTAKYDERWIRENALGENALCQAESLARHLPFSSGMRVLELGCGKATGSIFLAREFDVQVWATDSSTSATETFHRATALARESRVLPMRVDAHSLPFAKEFFDAVVAIDSYLYFGTDERYCPMSSSHQAGRFIGVVDIGFRREIRSVEEAPEYLRPQYEKYWSSIHTVNGGAALAEDGLVDVQCAQFLPESDQLLRNYWVERSPIRTRTRSCGRCRTTRSD